MGKASPSNDLNLFFGTWSNLNLRLFTLKIASSVALQCVENKKKNDEFKFGNWQVQPVQFYQERVILSNLETMHITLPAGIEITESRIEWKHQIRL